MTRRFLFGIVVATVFGLSLVGTVPLGSVLPVQARTQGDSERAGREHIRTIDHFVPHISTALVNEGEHVELFVRERVRHDDRRKKPVVLMVQGATTPTVPIFDLRFDDYNWMAFLANAGFDVFAMDLQGYGLSSRPGMEDPCNTQRNQQYLLIPSPLSEECAAPYPFKMAIQSDWDELDRVIDYVRELRGVETVSLVSWSRGGPRTGGYAARHQDKVDKLVLYSPAMYNRVGRSDPPPLPEPGFLMQLATIPDFFGIWDRQVACENQFRPEIREVLATSLLQQDALGSTWGDGQLWRAPLQNTLWGWNAEAARLIGMPTLIIRGDLDTQAPEGPQRNLFADLGTEHKVFVHVACAAHQLVWENQHMILLRASREWLRHGTFAGHDTGSFAVDVNGVVHQE
jgi:pimeloyl-ACP methyl ester carboxylesterase